MLLINTVNGDLILEKDAKYDGDLEVRGNIISADPEDKCSLYVAGKLVANDIKVHNLSAHEVTARDIEAWYLQSLDIHARSIEVRILDTAIVHCNSIHGWYIISEQKIDCQHDIFALDILTNDIDAGNIQSGTIICNSRSKKFENAETNVSRLYVRDLLSFHNKEVSK